MVLISCLTFDMFPKYGNTVNTVNPEIQLIQKNFQMNLKLRQKTEIYGVKTDLQGKTIVLISLKIELLETAG